MKGGYKEIIAIGDIHGRLCWEEIVARHPEAYFVFLGDYCDPYEERSRSALLHNLKKIIALKRSHPEQVTLLLGNHDLHYFVEGFPKGSRYDVKIAEQLKQIFLEERALFDYAFAYGQLIFMHAGMSEQWLKTCVQEPLLPSPAACFNHPETMADGGRALYTCGPMRFGPDPAGGIFWADEEELENSPKGWIQVVGHNWLDNVRCIHSVTAEKDEVADVLICDCLANRRYLRIDLSEEPIIRCYEMCLDEEEGTLMLESKIALQEQKG